MTGDTIAAVSTPRGKGGVAMLRISGAEATAVLGRVFVGADNLPLTNPMPRRAYYGKIYQTDVRGERSFLDDGIAVFYRAPHSFTGEDTVELTCHGGVLITEEVLGALLCAGARQAEAGEFTRRAFVNGKLQLSEAEALGSLLEAQTDSQRRLARAGLDGTLSRAVKALGDRLTLTLASVYVKIDYPDENLAELGDGEMRAAFTEVLQEVERLADTYRAGRAIMEGVQTVICGATNAGKSTLYNAMAGADAAIVTDIPGTTRDLLVRTVPFGQVTLQLCDTAGLRETEDPIEQIGVARSRRALEEAELVFAVFDASVPLGEEACAVMDLLRPCGGNVIAIANKADLGINPETLRALKQTFGEVYAISARDQKGLDDLRLAVGRRYLQESGISGSIDFENHAVVARERQHSALVRCAAGLREAIALLDAGAPTELYCQSIEYALADLEELDGKRGVSEQVVDAIFAHFCVGK